ncbi:MAG: hypothetical protein KBD92_06705 [Thiopseudomonas sp.]|jgi:hypothetical protein|uniref:hypothetical protein n=1 Tax=Denitrificimonas caeni TaxID=521720 RepID=UPI0003B70778|nr:hypothetical protein [Denitrificimonas caeni]MBP8771635.1 hypothetical protein [Thiopseudomonas sp.]MBP9615255.1 hypothetical protein [Thiopseudomonas sp.]
MTQIIWRSLLAFSLAMALSACQAPAKQISEPVIDQFAVSAQVFDTYVEGNQLVAAEQQLQTLGADYSDDERLPALQQRLAAAWLKNGQQALQNADVLAASTALMHAKRLMPQAPALTEGLSTALAEVQAQVVPPVVEQEIVKPVVKRPAAAKPAPRVPARKIATPIKTAPAVTVIEPTVMEPKLEQAPLATTKPRSKKARIIDPLADSTTLPMPMLASRNDHQLGRLLDDVASDVVRFRAAVSIEVADTRDFHWVATLLSARVKKLDASFKPRLQEVIRSDSPAQLVITPNKSL